MIMLWGQRGPQLGLFHILSMKEFIARGMDKLQEQDLCKEKLYSEAAMSSLMVENHNHTS